MKESNKIKILLRRKCYQCFGSGVVEVYDYFLEQEHGDLAEFEKRPCSYCQANGYLTWLIDYNEAEAWAEKKLSQFDWYFDYSDSVEVKRQARLELSVIEAVLKFLPEKKSISLWTTYCPYKTAAKLTS